VAAWLIHVYRVDSFYCGSGYEKSQGHAGSDPGDLIVARYSSTLTSANRRRRNNSFLLALFCVIDHALKVDHYYRLFSDHPSVVS
jgi:hypothetical protein